MAKKNTNNIAEEIENKIIDQITLGSGSRLIAFKPEKNLMGADLAVERRGGYKEKGIFFKILGFVGPAETDDFVKDFLQDDFKTDKNFYLLFVYFDEVKQKINNYIWLIPSLQFRDIAESVKSPEGKIFLRFQAPLDIKSKNKYSKFLINIKELGKLVLSAIESGKLDFEDVFFQENKIINLERLKEFIAEARRNTYASDATSTDNPRLLGSVQLEFQKGDYFYRDIYFSGDQKFVGQEIVYQNSKPVWAMNYIGDAIGKTEISFLKESLFELSGKCRFGQVSEFEKRELKYKDEGQGTLEDFSGHEEIFLEQKSIYKLDYQGGLISKKS